MLARGHDDHRTEEIHLGDAIFVEHAAPAPTPANDARYPVARRAQREHAPASTLYEEFHPFGTSAYAANDSGIEVSAKRYRYIGKERDEETGLYHLGARYYASWLGRWTAADPIGLGDGVNRYAYSHGRPITLSDPRGSRATRDPRIQVGRPDPNIEISKGNVDSPDLVPLEELQWEELPVPTEEGDPVDADVEATVGSVGAAGSGRPATLGEGAEAAASGFTKGLIVGAGTALIVGAAVAALPAAAAAAVGLGLAIVAGGLIGFELGSGGLDKAKRTVRRISRGQATAEEIHDAAEITGEIVGGIIAGTRRPKGGRGASAAEAEAFSRTTTGHHGATGDEILSIIESGELRPNKAGKVFLGGSPAETFAQGADRSRAAAFSIELEAGTAVRPLLGRRRPAPQTRP